MAANIVSTMDDVENSRKDIITNTSFKKDNSSKQRIFLQESFTYINLKSQTLSRFQYTILVQNKKYSREKR